mmetsp:Transcript_33968/g.85870  ORF Transcript_33968/g.85870 Transcript_33968/m.85870 type:complete len:229 (-) Transcript_33968:285-971(-)
MRSPLMEQEAPGVHWTWPLGGYPSSWLTSVSWAAPQPHYRHPPHHLLTLLRPCSPGLSAGAGPMSALQSQMSRCWGTTRALLTHQGPTPLSLSWKQITDVLLRLACWLDFRPRRPRSGRHCARYHSWVRLPRHRARLWTASLAGTPPQCRRCCPRRSPPPARSLPSSHRSLSIVVVYLPLQHPARSDRRAWCHPSLAVTVQQLRHEYQGQQQAALLPPLCWPQVIPGY